VLKISALLFDLDGTVYRGEEAIEGASEFITSLSIPYLFVTNRGNRKPETVAKQLRAMGIDCEKSDVLTSAQALADYLKKPSSAFCIGEEGLSSALMDCGITISEKNPDYVVVSYDRSFDYNKLLKALRFIKQGSKLVATNDDTVIYLEDGIAPEAGPLVAAIENASGVKAKIIGKPHSIIMEAAFSKLQIEREECVMIGDNLDTDILAAQNVGIRSALMLTGVSTLEEVEKSQIKPTWIAKDYKTLQCQLFGE